jgi:transposase-like protein
MLWYCRHCPWKGSEPERVMQRGKPGKISYVRCPECKKTVNVQRGGGKEGDQ